MGDEIKVLPGLTAIRRRPAMYLGSVDERARLSVVEHSLSHGLEHHKAGGCTRLDVHVATDDTVTVRDDGDALRPPPDAAWVRGHFQLFQWRLWPINHPYLGECSDDIALVCGASAWFEITVAQEGHRASYRWECAVPAGEVVRRAATADDPVGTTIRFQLAPEIFGTSAVPPAALKQRIDELTAFYPRLRLFLTID